MPVLAVPMRVRRLRYSTMRKIYQLILHYMKRTSKINHLENNHLFREHAKLIKVAHLQISKKMSFYCI